MTQLTNSQNDIFIINQSINDEDFSDGNNSLFDVTLSINTNKSHVLTTVDVRNICDYKIDINNNIYSDSKKYLLDIFNDSDSKNKLFVDSENNVNDISTNINQIKEDIAYLQGYFNNKSIVKEFYNIFVENKPSKYFGKISNYIVRNVINYTDSIDSFTENNYFKSDQKNYFDFLDYSLINNKTKNLFLYNIREENVISSNFNVETFICQNFLNLTQSLSVLSQGIISSYLNIDNENFVKLDGKDNNICESVDSSNVNYFKYIAEDSFVFSNVNFSKQEINSEKFSEDLPLTNWKNKGNKTSLSFGQASFTTNNILKVNAKRKIPIYPDFYHIGSLYDFSSGESSSSLSGFSGGRQHENDVSTKPAIEQIDLALTDIQSVDLNSLTKQNHSEFNNLIINESLNNESDIYRTDLNSGLTRGQFSDIEFFDSGVIDFSFYISNIIKESVTPSFPCIALQVLNKNLSKNMGMIYINNSLSTRSKLPGEPVSLASMKGENNELELKGFDFNSSFCNNTVEYAIKLDSLIKKIKIKSLKEKNINLDTFKEILKNIKNKKTSSKIISFTTNNLDNVQLTKENENLQKIIVTNSNNNTYSNFSLINNESNFNKTKSIVEKVYDNIENNDIDFENEKINNLIKNYYSGSYFKAASVFLRKVLEDLLTESNEAIDDALFSEKALSQYIYLKYMIDDNSDQETKNIIAKRFLEKSITKYLNCSENLINNSRFEFKFTNIDIDSYEDQILTNGTTFDLPAYQRKKSQVNKFYNDLEKTNDDYKKISKHVFSQNFLEKISNNFNYKKVDNIKIRLNARDTFISKVNNAIGDEQIPNDPNAASDEIKNIISSSVGEEKFEIGFSVLDSHLPFYYTKYTGAINEENKTGAKALSNKIKVERYNRSQAIQQNNELTLLDSANTTKISKFIYFQERDKNLSLAGGQEITDLFDKIIDDDFEHQSDNYIFSKITEAIFDLIKTVKSNWAEIKFENQDDINSFLNDNKEILDFSHEIISHYAVFYDYYIKKIHHETAIKLLSYDLAFADNVDIAESEYSIFSLSPNNNTTISDNRSSRDVRNAFLKSKNESVKTKSSVADILSSANIKSMFSGISTIKDNLASYENVKSLNKVIDPTKTTAINQIENISSILTHSDVYQAINFDIIKLIFNFYKYNVSVIDQEEIDNRMKKIDFIDSQKLSSNLFNAFYLNKIYENIDYLSSLNNKFLKNINKSKSADSFINDGNNFINILSVIENKNHELLKNEEVSNSILNGDLYNINLSLKEINSINKENLIKVKLSIIDHNRIDRIFLPKILLFSPLVFDPSSASIDNVISKLGFYNITQGSDNRQTVEYYKSQNDILDNEYLDFIINNKVNEKNIATPLLSDENKTNKDLIFSLLASSHIKSNIISKVIYTLHSINMNEKNTLSNISQEVFKIIDNMAEEKFIDIFEKSKDEIVGMFSLNSDSTYSLKFDENNYSIAVLLDSINKITSKEFLKKLLTLEDYSNINFEILPEDFVYIVQSLPNDEVEQNITDVGEISYNELTVEQKVSCLFENIDNDFLEANSIYKIDNSKAIDNYSISVDIEVI